MSRVDEARRRAAELASADGVGGTECLKPLPLTDVARLKIDAFPCEVPGVSGSRHATLPAAQPSSSTSRAGTGARAPAVEPVDRLASPAWAGTGSWSPADALGRCCRLTRRSPGTDPERSRNRFEPLERQAAHGQIGERHDLIAVDRCRPIRQSAAA
jgi:hypothetical protein